MGEGAIVKNAGDPKQVKTGKQKEKLRRESEINDIKAVMETKFGRRFMWRILSHCKVFESIWHGSALIHYQSGVQDVGHFVMAEIIAADKELFLLMQNENISNQEGDSP